MSCEGHSFKTIVYFLGITQIREVDLTFLHGSE